MITYAVGPVDPALVKVLGPDSVYRFLHEHAQAFAFSIGRTLAEGPTVYYPSNYFGPVELWPLVTPVHLTCFDATSIDHEPGTDWVCGPDCPR